jgi:hypothetical protein
VKVYFLAYQETLQEKGLHLIAAKVRSALAVEGELLDTGLSAFNEDQDFFLQLARAIVEREEVQETNFNQGIAHPFQAEQELDRYVLPEEAVPDEDPCSPNGNGVPMPVTPPVPQPASARKGDHAADTEHQAPLFASPDMPDQLPLF